MRCPGLCLLTVAFVAVAQAPSTAGAPSDGGTSDGRIIVAPDVCAAMATLAPAGAAYTAGVDAGGRAVAPADLPGGANLAMSEFPIEITVDLKKRLGLPADDRLFRGVGRLGFVVIRGDRAYFNGQELTNPEQTVLTEACRGRR
jgi:hypothetical protein